MLNIMHIIRHMASDITCVGHYGPASFNYNEIDQARRKNRRAKAHRGTK